MALFKSNELFSSLFLFTAFSDMPIHLHCIPGELHTFQAMCECGFARGRTWGGIRNAHNGQAFLTFDRDTQGWLAVAPSIDNAAAVRVKMQWERWWSWTRDVGIYVDKICLQRLYSLLEYGKKALERKGKEKSRCTYS